MDSRKPTGDYEVIIGMEVHAQLDTKSKMFCGCRADVFGAEPNTLVCPVCLGMPGVLPVINRRAVECTIMTGLALNCSIAEFSRFARKNYNYPDLVKGYQISQYELPLCHNGWLEIEADDTTKRVRIERVHLEEDTGKLFHMGTYSLVDYNRSGVPLMEIVSEPDMRSAAEAYAYLTKLRQILRYLGVSSGDMEKGAMRCEVNVSLRPAGTETLGTKVEIKNLNSFRSVKMALEYEIQRQAEILDKGGTVEQVTMGWDEERQRTVVQRSKEFAHDYRYFPEPDLPPLEISREWVAEIRAQLPELPDAKCDRFVAQYGLSVYDATVLSAEREVADYFENCVALYPQAKTVANWISGEIFRRMNEAGLSITEIKVTPQGLAGLLNLVEKGAINLNTARRVFIEMLESGRSAEAIVAEQGLAQMSDIETLERIVDEVLAANPDQVQQYLAGKETVARWLVGQVMKATQGKANPQLVNKSLSEKLQALQRLREDKKSATHL
ncbi:MAG: Asp-tRNA(Asn)/Glu-tRNA(Gln) amidotransferase subunit GatB [Anaerolineae bacterium]|jgi:aspartyl-tRNA(Asn)/glutamyl-tRNA(Gln) amidotransferase subunit B|nr:Asp-tRNA(Asn)/Glu-tRNA(Gln) amidotransferase subunit GatB [Anaerolineae bacterium]MDH7473834.1 Asp-tRNA(Asn)/Glu-tRNA(Gln) amidotransferase subunit GatB [Anaerolineae bacterium]